MNYQLHYDALVRRAKNRGRVTGYVERHHVIPRCMGGLEDANNIVVLTAEEHFVAHQLLVKMHPGHKGLVWAASAMCGSPQRTCRTNKLYGWLRRRFAVMMSESQKGRVFSAETREKMAAAKRGKKHGPRPAQWRENIAKGRTGIPHTEAAKEKMSKARRGVKIGPMSEESKRKKSESMKRYAETADYGYLRKPEYRQAQSVHMKKIWAERKQS